MKIIFKKYIILLSVFLTFCSSLSEVEIFDERNDGSRKLLWVKIPERVTEEKLVEIGDDFKDKYSSFDKFFIRIFVPSGDTIVFWATINVEEDIKTEILGSTIVENKTLLSPELDGIDTSKIIGKWIDNTPAVSKTVIYYTKSDTTFMRTVYKDGSFGDRKLTIKGNVYHVNEGEWHTIEPNGNLAIYGVNGKYYEYPLIK